MLQIEKTGHRSRGRRVLADVLKSVLVSGLIYGLVFGLITVQSAYAVDSGDVLRRDLRLMADWFAGSFDNVEQVYFQGELDTPAVARERRLRRVAALTESDSGPAFSVTHRYPGDHASAGSDPDTPAGAWVSVLRAADAAGAIVEDRFIGGDALPGAGDAAPDCTIHWRRLHDQFLGETHAGPCTSVTPAVGGTPTRFFLSATAYGSVMAAHTNSVPEAGPGNGPGGSGYRLLKARPFSCWVSLANEAAEGGWDFHPGLKTDDQGGAVWVAKTGGADTSKYGLRLRNVRWPYGRNRDSLVLYIHREGEARAVSYAWTEPEGTRIAVNLRWIQASCTLRQD